MVNSISSSFIRGLCDELGLNTKIDSDGDIAIRLEADSDFNHDVIIFLRVIDNKLLRVFAMSEIKVTQSQVGKTLIALNEYNNKSVYMKAYIGTDGSPITERFELIDENVSEEFIKENCIKLMLNQSWKFFKEYFAEY